MAKLLKYDTNSKIVFSEFGISSFSQYNYEYSTKFYYI